jgi:hypothetical protein
MTNPESDPILGHLHTILNAAIVACDGAAVVECLRHVETYAGRDYAHRLMAHLLGVDQPSAGTW